MDINQQKEKFSDAYLQAVASVAGYLRTSDLAVPRILVVVLIPENLREWLKHSQQELCMISCGYWMSLRGMPETENLRTVTVSLPINNQFSVEKLHSIMHLLSQGDKL